MHATYWCGILAAWVSTGAFARPHQGHCDATSGQLTCAATSDSGRTLSLRFPTVSVTTDTAEAVFCSLPAGPLEKAELWMSMGDEGHGSGPTTLTPQGENCWAIGDIEFLMPGTWQIKLRFADGDQGVVDVPVQ